MSLLRGGAQEGITVRRNHDGPRYGFLLRNVV
jgi:hypothetical protein